VALQLFCVFRNPKEGGTGLHTARFWTPGKTSPPLLRNAVEATEESERHELTVEGDSCLGE